MWTALNVVNKREPGGRGQASRAEVVHVETGKLRRGLNGKGCPRLQNSPCKGPEVGELSEFEGSREGQRGWGRGHTGRLGHTGR